MQISDDFPMSTEVESGLNPQFVPPVLVAFGMYPMRDDAKSKVAGHDVFVDVEHVKIAIPGDKNSLFFQPATDVHRKRFPNAYASYKTREREPVEGMPVEQWAAINRSIALTLKAANIPTVEAFAAVHQGNIDRIGISNARELQAMARAFLEQAKDNAAVAKIAAEKQALEDRLRALEARHSDDATKVSSEPVEATVAVGADAAKARRPAARAHAG